MRSDYKKLGPYIRLVSERNKELQEVPLMGLSITKKFIPSIANLIGTDMSTYRTINRNQFAYSPVTSRNGDKITIALFQDYDKGLISQAYTPFEVIDTNEVDPEYLMMWFRRTEFDRYARFKSHGSARELFCWEDFCEMELPIPAIIQQKEIVKEYNVIQDRIDHNKQLIQKLEETAQAIYKQWFVDFEFPDEEGKPYKSNGGKMVESELGEIPKGWEMGSLENLALQSMGFPFNGEEYSFEDGISVLRGENVSERFLRWDNHKKWKDEISIRMKNCFLHENDIVIGMDGSKVGKNWAKVSKYDLPLLLAQRVSCIRAKKNEYQNFIFYSMCVLGFEGYVSQVQTGTSIPHISGPQIFDFPLVIPESKVVEKFDTFISKMVIHDFNMNAENKQLINIKNLLLSKLATKKN